MRPKGIGLILLVVVAIIAAALGWFLFTSRPAAAPNQPASSRRPARLQPPVAIQDGKTIDFSSGKPVIKDSPEEKAIINRATHEMDEAAKNVTFAPTEKPANAEKLPKPPLAPPGKG